LFNMTPNNKTLHIYSLTEVVNSWVNQKLLLVSVFFTTKMILEMFLKTYRLLILQIIWQSLLQLFVLWKQLTAIKILLYAQTRSIVLIVLLHGMLIGKVGDGSARKINRCLTRSIFGKYCHCWRNNKIFFS
jgi:hypothetical protein